MKQLFQDIHIDSIMTFLKEIHIFNKILSLIFKKNVFCFIPIMPIDSIIASL